MEWNYLSIPSTYDNGNCHSLDKLCLSALIENVLASRPVVFKGEYIDTQAHAHIHTHSGVSKVKYSTLEPNRGIVS